MKQVLLTGLAAALTVTAAGRISPSEANQDSSPHPDEAHPKNALQEAPKTQNNNFSASKVAEPAQSGKSQAANATKVGERQSDAAIANPASIVATIRVHSQSGRQASTVYVRNIPVVTFLGDELNASEQNGIKVASTDPNLKSVTSPSANSVKDPVWRASTIAAKLNQLEETGIDAKTIKVSWSEKRKSYLIKSNDTHLIEVTEKNTLLPNAKKGAGKDALQIANRLRYQLGKAIALKDIEGLPKPKDVQTIAMGPVRFQIQGMASWYGPGFDGNLTANGETYNRYGLTAASRTLPFGTKVRVTNLDNGRTVVVRINDRGPYVGDRVLDLSQGAAQILGTVSSGISSVRLDILE
jgi:rare lipoprotein A